ncbi:MAG: sulfatase [Planctomycetota bacterium]|jgi:hypothetical protein
MPESRRGTASPERTSALGALALLAACSVNEPVDVPERPERVIVMFLVDTLRADRLTVYGHEGTTSPELEALARRGVVFERAWSPAPWTLPSTASLLTGIDPSGHGAGLNGEWRDLDDQIPDGLTDEVTTLAERFADAGWRCEAMVTNPFVGFGLERGFDPFVLQHTEGAEVVRYGLERLAVEDDRPLFLLLHLIDVHDPLLIPDEDVLAADPSEERVPLWARTFELLAEVPEHRDARMRVYDGAVRYVDRQLGDLVSGIEALGLADVTTIAFTSDHGEEVYDSAALQIQAEYRQPESRRALGHGHTLFEEQLHVPLVIAGAGVERPGRHAGLVASHDLAPTLLELGDVDFDPTTLDTRSLAPVLSGETLEERPLLATGIAYGPDRASLTSGDWQLVRGGEGERDVMVEIGDVLRRDRAAEHPDLSERMRTDLDALRARAAVRSGSTIELDEAQRARLRALGYLGDDE